MILSIKAGADPASTKQIRIEADGELCENVEVLEADNDRGNKTAIVKVTWNEHQNDRADSVHPEVARKPRASGQRADQSAGEVPDNGGV